MKKIVYVDMDGVIADFEAGINSIDPTIEWTSDELDLDYICIANPHIFETLPEIPDGIEAVKKLSQHYEIYFLSTPMHSVPESYMDKRKWIKEKFGEWAEKRLILSHRKDLNKGEFLIDDRLKNGSEKFDGHHIHFRTELFPDWNSVLKFLIK
ncbi:MAG: hypothetical protein ABIP51_18300 [Bacteroidia bacterium]